MKNELQQFNAIAYAANSHEKRGAGSIRVRIDGGSLHGVNVSCSRQDRRVYRSGAKLLVTGRLVDVGGYVKASAVQIVG